jgi:hypothetical protein
MRPRVEQKRTCKVLGFLSSLPGCEVIRTFAGFMHLQSCSLDTDLELTECFA